MNITALQLARAIYESRWVRSWPAWEQTTEWYRFQQIAYAERLLVRIKQANH